MQVLYVPALALLVFGLLVLVALAVRLGRAVRRFGAVRGVLSEHVRDRASLLRARSAAVRVAVDRRWRDGPAPSAPRTIGASVEWEDDRA